MAAFIIRWLGRLSAPLVNRLFLKKLSGLDQVPRSGPYIIASNHISVPDQWLIANQIVGRDHRLVSYLARDDFWFTRSWSRLMARLFSALPIDWRVPSAVLDEAKTVLKDGGVIGIFIEGTRNFDPESLVLGKTGAVRLALAAHCPIVPVGYIGPEIVTLLIGSKNLIKRNLASIHFGKPLDFSSYYNQPITRELLYSLTDEVMIEIGKLCNKKPRLHI